jgi:hypothetical protein
MIAELLRFLVRKGVIVAPKRHLYAVELQVLLDGKVIKQFPAEVMATGRRAAKFDVSKRLTFKTGTVAKKIDLIKHS